AEPLEARREGRRVADEDNDVHRERLGQPLRREQRDRVLDERPRVREPGTADARQVATRAGDVGGPAQGAQLGAEAIAEPDRLLEACAVAAFVLTGHDGEIAVEAGRAEPGRSARVERLVDVGDAGREREHLPDPGGARAVRAGDEDRPPVAHRASGARNTYRSAL